MFHTNRYVNSLGYVILVESGELRHVCNLQTQKGCTQHMWLNHTQENGSFEMRFRFISFSGFPF